MDSTAYFVLLVLVFEVLVFERPGRVEPAVDVGSPTV
jgi:hypothetical protein